jgi:hypothetical protein
MNKTCTPLSTVLKVIQFSDGLGDVSKVHRLMLVSPELHWEVQDWLPEVGCRMSDSRMMSLAWLAARRCV